MLENIFAELAKPHANAYRVARMIAPLASRADHTEALLNGIRTFCALLMVDTWTISAQWSSGPAALTLAAICCVLYSISPSPLNSLTLPLRTLLLLSLFSFVVKFGLMVQISDLCISLLRNAMSERGVQQRRLTPALHKLRRIYAAPGRHHQPAAREFASIIWRLHCSLSQLEQAPEIGTLTERTT